MTNSLPDRLTKMGWNEIANHLEALLEDAARDSLSYSAFLDTLLSLEEKGKADRALKNRLQQSRLPQIKTLDNFDFTFQPSLDEKRIRDVIAREFPRDAQNILFLGPPGVGKTHLALAITYEMIKKGYRALCLTSHEFLEKAKEAMEKGDTKRFVRMLTKTDILLLDEFGFEPMDSHSANLLLQIVAQRYERGSIIITSNRSVSEWAEIVGNAALATAILDRLLHHSKAFQIRGESYRLREKKKAGFVFKATETAVNEENHRS
ncbi:IS21-like element helper ATPase IstB [Candidatus Formimonas warabiya]|uniref:AAA+ ATPase domain-containing protein n=1 Tax=Formimonas warabiya TaxID=1761012 RepID=A0A3G1KP65_FORW1|nr:IS21-like element helper ATPase IstB [Candidatus Formimonas warabiya]ATW24271.1 hypothetical protein DCMF_05240 [Candidatus Formimonas warabiya]